MPLHCFEQRQPCRQRAAPLSENPHGYRQQHDEDVDPPNGRKHLQRPHAGDPRADEVVHPERVDVTKIERSKRLRSVSTALLI